MFLTRLSDLFLILRRTGSRSGRRRGRIGCTVAGRRRVGVLVAPPQKGLDLVGRHVRQEGGDQRHHERLHLPRGASHRPDRHGRRAAPLPSGPLRLADRGGLVRRLRYGACGGGWSGGRWRGDVGSAAGEEARPLQLNSYVVPGEPVSTKRRVHRHTRWSRGGGTRTRRGCRRRWRCW